MVGHRLVLLVAIVLLQAFTAVAEPVTVETSLGHQIVGFTSTSSGVDSFLGIQFALVGERFSRSTLIDDTKGDDNKDDEVSSMATGTIINATSYGPYCYQSLPPNSEFGNLAATQQDEECLYLNIWRPVNTTPASSLPTMVYIHGGGFVIGSGAEPIYNGANLAREQNVVVVTINYRLGLFGGLVTGENGYGGLNLIHDQINALMWVNKHIESFGGNPSDVTIFGESAGSVSVCMLNVSPLADGLFHRSIQQSGECAFGIIVPYTAEQGAAITEAVLNVTGASSVSELSDATKFPADALAPVAGSLNVGWITVDGWVLPEQPRQLYEDPNNIVPTDIIIGSNSYDSALAVLFPPEVFMSMAANMEVEIQTLFGGTDDGESAAKKVLQAYSPANYGDNQVAAYAQFWGDFQFRCASRQFAAFVSSKLAGKIFLYNYAYRSAFDPNVVNGLYDLAGIDDDMWATHAAEIPMVLGTSDGFRAWYNDTALELSQDDLALGTEMMARWANFARSGDPNTVDYNGWDPVDHQETSESSSSEVTSIPTFLFQKGGGVMTPVQEKVDQCSAFYPSPQTEDTSQGLFERSNMRLVAMLFAICQAFLLL